ncbi:polysaccharide biosynthesis protein [Listeria rocourtiae]|uniref:polysaccharide biosynthesis protein n=1 Tax=Listeria rocourtiae TaxID=647910 RepID=UPI001628C093|nr:nucleoside-diphosphate sugar epimerase/dehydratase [Listeria rocourtiae]MBC1605522.1 polysaccharide biosynthesis protein [Listeria rocourtiae]
MEILRRVGLWSVVDTGMIWLAVAFAFYMADAGNAVIMGIVMTVVYHVFALVFQLQGRTWSHTSVQDLVAIVKVVSLAVAVSMPMMVAMTGFSNFDIRFFIFMFIAQLLLIAGTRLGVRVRCERSQQRTQSIRTLIIGAGEAGTQLVQQLHKDTKSNVLPVGFIDDDKKKQRTRLLDVPVLGGMENLETLIAKAQAEQIIIAMPSILRTTLQAITEQAVATGIPVKTMPNMADILSGKLNVSQVQEVEVEDLLGRDPVQLDLAKIATNLTGKTVLVTGAGGSIGSEICRQIMEFAPKKILLLGHGEHSIYQIHRELGQSEGDTQLLPLIVDIQDMKRLRDVMQTHQPDMIYHAAAHKHVPLMEANPLEAVKNNVYGTRNVAQVAHEIGAESMVMVSSDKAVNPPNVMGSTKRIAEMIIQSFHEKSNTKFVAVRFGNVLGSSGSVVPLFKEQIKKGQPITITDRRMTRYFMTIPEAAKLVLQAGSLAQGGEIFVLDMGEPVKIVDLAKSLIRLSGLTEVEIPIIETGIRPGEKLYEELLTTDELVAEQVFPKIFVGKVMPVQEKVLLDYLQTILQLSDQKAAEKTIQLANASRIQGDEKIV